MQLCAGCALRSEKCCIGPRQFWVKEVFDWEASESARQNARRQSMSPEPRSWHFGVLPFTGTGHLNPLIALSQEMVRRGHRVTFCEKPKVEDRVRRAGLEFVPICGRKATTSRRAPKPGAGIRAEIATLRFNLQRVIGDVERYLEEAPKALASTGVNALLTNEVALTGPTVAETLRLPYFLISTTVPHHFGWNGWSWITGH